MFAVLPVVAHASLGLRIFETSNESIHVEVIEPGSEPGCAIKDAKSFGPKAIIGKVTDTLYIQKLNSEVGEEAHSLKAARMGGGIYVHLPYFIPPGPCQNVAFALPLARYIVEGSADFFQVLVLHSAGIIGQAQAKSRIMNAAANCTKFADGRTLVEKNAQRAFDYREPYDCGMVYYMTSYYTSGMPVAEFVAALTTALSGDQNYSPNRDSLCLLYEATCKNERLKALAGNRERALPQIAWLDAQLIHPPVLQ